MTTWTEAEALFAKALPGYEPREAQRNLAFKIEDALSVTRSHLLAQAGCGTGKSYAGIVPAIRLSRETGLPVILATATKALQDQYAGKDLPFLQSVLGDFSFAVLKGRSNYVCRAKATEVADSYAADVLAELADDPQATGDFDSLRTELDWKQKAALTTSSDECPGKRDCPFGDVCFAEKAKQRAKESNVVVANHALLATDLAIKAMQEEMGVPADKVGGILPRFSGVVIDEAHELNEYTTNALGGEAGRNSYQRLGNDISQFLGSTDARAQVQDAVDGLYRKIDRILAEGRDSTIALDETRLSKIAEEAFDLIQVLSKLQSKIEAAISHGDDVRTLQRKRLIKRTENSINKLKDVILSDPEALVRWVERGDEKRGNLLKWAPLDVSEFLRANLWSKVPAALLSATLAVGNDFSYISAQLGLDEPQSFDAGSPFNFAKQALTFVPDIPAPAQPTTQQWKAASIEVTAKLVEAAKGRALLLFTSRTDMNDAHSALKSRIQSLGHRVLKQGELPNKQLAEIFASDEHSVLFALKSFFTGVDIQGDSLRLVVMNKLTFPVPTDVIVKARCDVIDAKATNKWKDGSFPTYTVPTMALTLLQGYGRLIRTRNDRGVVAILDSRLFTKSGAYGAKIMKTLPNAPVTRDLDEATGYLESLEG